MATHMRRSRHGSAAESVTPRKLALMWRAAQTYLVRECGRAGERGG